MKKYVCLTILSVGCTLGALGADIVVVGGTGTSSGDGLIRGFNPAPQDVAVATPQTAVGIGNSFGFNNFGPPLGFIFGVDSNFVAVFTNQAGTNFVALPFAATNLAPFGGRIPLGPLAPPFAANPATNAFPLPPSAVGPQAPIVDLQPLSPIAPVIPPTGTPIPPTLSPTGRPLAPPTTPTPIMPPSGTPLPSPTPIPPPSTAIPPRSTPIPPPSTQTPPAGIPAPR